MSLIAQIHHLISPAPAPVEAAAAPAATGQAVAYLGFQSFPSLSLCKHTPSVDRLAGLFSAHPALSGEFQDTLMLAQNCWDHLAPIPAAQASNVHALLGLLCFVSSEELVYQPKLDLVAHVMRAVTESEASDALAGITEHLEKRWPEFAQERPEIIEFIAEELLAVCQEKGIQWSYHLTPPDEAIRELLAIVNNTPVRVTILEEENRSNWSVAYRARHAPSPASDIIRFFSGAFEKARDAHHEHGEYLEIQFREATDLLPELLKRGLELAELKATVEREIPARFSKVEVMLNPDGTRYIRKTLKDDPRLKNNFAVLCHGLANAIRFSKTLGEAMPKILGISLSDDNEWQICLEYCAGGDFWTYMNSARFNFRDPRQTVAVAYYFSKLITAAHDNGIIHRDLKFSNALIRKPNGDPRDGVLADMDFSLRKAEANYYRGSTHRLGSFLPPESQTLVYVPDFSTDIFAAGVSFFSMLSGKDVPTDSRTGIPQIDMRLIEDRHPLKQIIAKAVEQDPGKRFLTSGAMMAAIQIAAAGM